MRRLTFLLKPQFRVNVSRYCSTELSKPDHHVSIKPSVLAEQDVNDLEEINPHFPVGFNLAAFVNKSETLQELIKLGVDLNKIENNPQRAEELLKLDFEKDIKPRIRFLHDLGVEANELGVYFTKNPMIFQENIEDMIVRVNYLRSKNFKPKEITRIVQKNPFWLLFTTQRIDKRLGFFQKNFQLTGHETRAVAVSKPRLITYHLEFVRKATFSIKEEMGFNKGETKQLLLNAPKLWMIDQNSLIEKFGYIHNVMGISHKQLISDPNILFSREFRIKQRHKFLKFLGRAQYDPKKELYVSLQSLVSGNDEEFVLNVAKSNLDTFETFLKTA